MERSGVIEKLLTIPQRRTTPLRELRDFFEKSADVDWRERLRWFMLQFSGSVLDVPGPQAIWEISRDEKIVIALSRDSSVENRLNLMIVHEISYDYLHTLWRVVHECDLELPSDQTRTEQMEMAMRMALSNPRYVEQIADMFEMKRKERQSLIDRVTIRHAGNQKSEKKKVVLTASQKQVVNLFHNGEKVTIQDLGTRAQKTVHPQTIDALVDRGVIIRAGDLLQLSESTRRSMK